MTMRVLRRRQHAKSANRPAAPISLSLRAGAPVGSGVRALYPVDVSGRKVDREAWAKVVAELMAAETRGKITPFAKLVDVNPRTVSHWLDRDVNVSEESVRKVAAATKRAPMDLLVAVGYYSRAEVSPERPDADDPEMDLILALAVDEDMKMRMIERLLELRRRDNDRLEEIKRQDQERRMADLRWIVERGA